MEGDNAEPSTGFQEIQSLGQKTLERIEFAVYRDPKGLKSAGGRMNSK